MDLLQLVGNLLLITFLGVLVAFNPMLIVVDILLVLKTKRPILNTIILAAGFMSSILVLFIIARLFIDPDSQISLRNLNDQLDIPPLVDLLAGTALLIYVLNRYRRQKLGEGARSQINFKIPEKPYQLFGFAFVKAAISLTNIFAILILAKLAVANDWNTATGLLAVFWLLAIGIIPLAAIAYYRQFKHESLISIDKRINAIMSRKAEIVIIYALGAVGCFFTASGLINLIWG